MQVDSLIAKIIAMKNRVVRQRRLATGDASFASPSITTVADLFNVDDSNVANGAGKIPIESGLLLIAGPPGGYKTTILKSIAQKFPSWHALDEPTRDPMVSLSLYTWLDELVPEGWYYDGPPNPTDEACAEKLEIEWPVTFPRDANKLIDRAATLPEDLVLLDTYRNTLIDAWTTEGNRSIARPGRVICVDSLTVLFFEVEGQTGRGGVSKRLKQAFTALHQLAVAANIVLIATYNDLALSEEERIMIEVILRSGTWGLATINSDDKRSPDVQRLQMKARGHASNTAATGKSPLTIALTFEMRDDYRGPSAIRLIKEI